MTPSAQICVICGSLVAVLFILACVFAPKRPKPDRTRYESELELARQAIARGDIDAFHHHVDMAERHLECATQKPQ